MSSRSTARVIFAMAGLAAPISSHHFAGIAASCIAYQAMPMPLSNTIQHELIKLLRRRLEIGETRGPAVVSDEPPEGASLGLINRERPRTKRGLIGQHELGCSRVTFQREVILPAPAKIPP